MNRHLKFLFALSLVVVMLASCKKKTSDTGLLTSHKWVLATSTATYNDSVGVSHNLITTDTSCPTTSYTEFHERTPNNALRLAYTYITATSATCPQYYYNPIIDITSWDIDADNANLYINGNQQTGLNGQWYTLSSISSSGMTLVYQQDEVASYGVYPNYHTTYHTVTYTQTYTVK